MSCVLGKNSLAEPIPIQVWFEFNFPSSRPGKESSLPYYLPLAKERIIGFISFPDVFELCEMQTVSFRIRTRVGETTSDRDNHYATSTSSKYKADKK